MATLVAAFVLGWLEWRRADRSRRGLRLAAFVSSLAALGLLGVRPAWQRVPGVASNGTSEAMVWTGGSPRYESESVKQTLQRVPADHRFALPAAELPPGEQAAAIPDLAYLRRHFPDVAAVHLVGEGLTPAELEALRDCVITFHPSERHFFMPAVDFLSCPSEISVGAPLVVQGRVGGLTPGATVVVSLEAPDGTTTETSVRAGGAGKEAAFEVKAPPLATAGRFVWRLRLAAPAQGGHAFAEEELGVSVIDPPLPRVLVLESSPHPDTAVLRRWLERLGGRMTVRTRVGADHYQFASTHGAPGDFTTLDEPLLANFDLLLADHAALAALSSAEHALLARSVATTGLGLLLAGVPSESSPGKNGVTSPQDGEATVFLLPWKLAPLELSGQGDTAAAPPRLVRPQEEGQAPVSDLQIPAEAAEILPARERLDPLLTDGQGHVLAARVQKGGGQVGLTLVRDTWRWPLENDPAAFARYWSVLFSKLSRSQSDAGIGRWSLADGVGGPRFAQEPLELTWTGDIAPTQPATVVREGNPASAVDLALAQDANESHRWSAMYWPREPGWHRVTLPATGAAMDFFISGDTWEHLRAARRRAATECLAEWSLAQWRLTAASIAGPPKTETVPLPAGWLFAGFVASAGFLWEERYFRPRLASHSAGPAPG